MGEDAFWVVATLALLAAALVVLFRIRMPSWARLSVLSALYILLPQQSSDYRLLILFLPLLAYLYLIIVAIKNTLRGFTAKHR